MNMYIINILLRMTQALKLNSHLLKLTWLRTLCYLGTVKTIIVPEKLCGREFAFRDKLGGRRNKKKGPDKIPFQPLSGLEDKSNTHFQAVSCW